MDGWEDYERKNEQNIPLLHYSWKVNQSGLLQHEKSRLCCIVDFISISLFECWMGDLSKGTFPLSFIPSAGVNKFLLSCLKTSFPFLIAKSQVVNNHPSAAGWTLYKRDYIRWWGRRQRGIKANQLKNILTGQLSKFLHSCALWDCKGWVCTCSVKMELKRCSAILASPNTFLKSPLNSFHTKNVNLTPFMNCMNADVVNILYHITGHVH